MEPVSIKETKELLEALGEIAVTVKKVAKDGIKVDDISHLVALAQKMDVIVDGAKGADEIPKELKDLDQTEVLEIIGQIYQISDSINKA